MLIFHKNRRDIIAKAFIDIFKLTFIASCVSGFFPGFNIGIKIAILCSIILSLIIGFIVCPRPEKEN